jgi:hypothetical protein
MQLWHKLALAALGLAASQAQAVPLIANVPGTSPVSTAGSDLVLLMKDNTNASYFVADLGVSVSSLNSFSNLQSATNNGNSGQYSLYGDSGVAGSMTTSAFSSPTTVTNAAAWLTAHSGDSITWTIMGYAIGNGTQTAGQQAAVVGSNTDFLNSVPSTSDVATMVGGIKNFFSYLNNNSASFTNGVSSTYGYNDASGGGQAGVTFSSYANGVGVGTAQSLYEVTSAGSGNDANIYRSLGTLTLSTAGVLSYAAPVPVPAALWLLGSGVMGLLGIGRRRKVEAA